MASIGLEPTFIPQRLPKVVRNALVVAAVGALLGVLFAATSTDDFMQHLDRQVHSIHCSFVPGAAAELGDNGCKAVMMSPYSAFFRESLWGGLPVSLCALAVYAFLAFRVALLLWARAASRAQTLFLLLAAGLPLGMTFIYAFLAATKVGATCKVCVGIYVASFVVFGGALVAHLKNPAPQELTPPTGVLLGGFAQGVGFVGALCLTYLLVVPAGNPKNALTGCGALVSAEDAAGVMVPLGEGRGGEAAIEVLDPLCPACKAFEERLSASGLRGRLSLKAVLFPLDNTCNWMVTEALHPGACAVSEAVLCAAGFGATKDEPAAREVLQYAFARQEALRTLAARDEPGLRAQLERDFPKLKGCLGGNVVKSRLTKSLRWGVANAIPVLTPQLFVGTARMCDEDSDLGLEYTLGRLLSPQGKAARASVKPPRPAAARPTAPKPAAPASEEESP